MSWPRRILLLTLGQTWVVATTLPRRYLFDLRRSESWPRRHFLNWDLIESWLRLLTFSQRWHLFPWAGPLAKKNMRMNVRHNAYQYERLEILEMSKCVKIESRTRQSTSVENAFEAYLGPFWISTRRKWSRRFWRPKSTGDPGPWCGSEISTLSISKRHRRIRVDLLNKDVSIWGGTWPQKLLLGFGLIVQKSRNA